ncbi:MAG: penicillin acylase family protein [Porticoccaceae bacterium]
MAQLSFRSLRRWSLRLVLLPSLLATTAAGYGYWFLRASLPQLEGTVTSEQLHSPVTIDRDIRGIPTISGSDRNDIAFALGFLHAQERFFQMDLLRRNSAGELSELFGTLALNHDKAVRVHQFRQRALRAFAAMGAEDQALLKTYTEGVNQGLNDLHKAPFEYALLRTPPKPWQVEDAFLALFSMYIDLQPELSEYERSLAVLRDSLPADWFAFLVPEGGEWDAPIQGPAYAFDDRLPKQPLAQLQLPADATATASLHSGSYRDYVEVGSNNWSVGGALTDYPSGMVANDMHLGLNVPNIWYRASWHLPTDNRRVTGATLPGVPVMVVGSNEHIAWGFTNTYGDYQDSIVLQVNDAGDAYLTPDGWQPFSVETETIQVKGAPAEAMEIKHTIWGPVIGEDHKHRPLALRWVAHDPEGANLNIRQLEAADNVDEAVQLAATMGIPGQNLNVVDRDGNQGWTIAGRLPKRVGFIGERLSSKYPQQDWSSGQLRWDGYLSAADYPRVINPAGNRIWTANARVVSGAMLDKIGHGSYALGARQQQIANDLHAKNHFSEQDMLAIALDDRALFLNRWQQLLLNLARDNADGANGIDNADTLAELLENWQGRASKTSSGYLIVKRFRENVIGASTGRVIQKLDEEFDFFDPERASVYLEYPTWALITEQPAEHIPEGYRNWHEFLVAQANKTLRDLTANGKPLREQTWGDANTLTIRHPLSSAIPLLGGLLNMPSEGMDGDTYMPRVQKPKMGASERMVVAPGHEEKGIFHMATGQSGHPLSGYYTMGHRDWVEGNASPFLPGQEKWRLLLSPN